MDSARPAPSGVSNRLQMPLTVFDCKGIPTSRRVRIEGAVVAAGRNLSRPYEAWIRARRRIIFQHHYPDGVRGTFPASTFVLNRSFRRARPD